MKLTEISQQLDKLQRLEADKENLEFELAMLEFSESTYRLDWQRIKLEEKIKDLDAKILVTALFS